MNNNYSMGRYDTFMGRQGPPWKSVAAGSPIKNNYNIEKLRPHVHPRSVEMDELYPDLRGSYYSRIPPLSPHRYGYSGSDKFPLLGNDTSGPSNHYHKSSDIPSEIPDGSIQYHAKGGPPLDNHGRPTYGVKDHSYSSGLDFQSQGQGHFFQDARDQPEKPLYDSPSSFPHVHRTLPYNNREGYAERQWGTYVHSALPRNRIPGENRYEYKSRHDRRPHSHEALPLNRNGLHNNFTPRARAGEGPPWGDRELWELDNTKRYNSLPALNERKQPDPNLFLPYDGYRRNIKQWGHQRAFWDDSLDPSFLRYLADPRNAESFIERFVESCIQENLVLEIAAEVLVESRELQELLDRTSKPVILAANDVLNEVLDVELLSIVKEERQMAIAQFWQDIAGRREIIEPVRDEIVMATVKEELRLVAADAVGELVDDYFTEKEVVTIYNALYEDAMGGLLEGVVEDTLLDLSLESLIDDCIDEEIQDCGRSFVADVYARGHPQLPLSNRQRGRESLEIQQKCVEIAPDAFILDVLLKNLKNRNQVWTDVEYKEKLLDGMILDQLLNQNLRIQEAVETTQENMPVKRFHDKLADEEGLNTLLDSLSVSLDEDMSQQDQAESELQRLMNSTATTPAYLQ